MPADIPVRDVMTTDVVTFHVDDDVRTAMQTLVDRGVDGGPVVDDDGSVVGVLTTGDLIVRQSRLHFPSVIVFLGASFEIGRRRDFDDDLEKVLGSSVREVMNEPAITCRSDTTLEEAATLMHDHRVARLPVVDDGRLVGIVSRVDLLRGALASS